MTKRIICDLDNTITVHSSSSDYSTKTPNTKIIEKLRIYSLNGYEIVIFTARNMNTYKGDLEKIKELTLPIIIDWLERHCVPYSEIIVGKPWCDDGFYVDDKAIRPDEFLNLSEQQIVQLVK